MNRTELPTTYALIKSSLYGTPLLRAKLWPVRIARYRSAFVVQVKMFNRFWVTLTDTVIFSYDNPFKFSSYGAACCWAVLEVEHIVGRRPDSELTCEQALMPTGFEAIRDSLGASEAT